MGQELDAPVADCGIFAALADAVDLDIAVEGESAAVAVVVAAAAEQQRLVQADCERSRMYPAFDHHSLLSPTLSLHCSLVDRSPRHWLKYLSRR